MADAGGLALDGTVHQLDPRIRVVWAVSSTVPWLVLGVAGVVAAVVTGHPALAGLAAAVAVVVAVVGLSIVGWRWRCWQWSAWDDALELQHGVLNRHTWSFPTTASSRSTSIAIRSTGCSASRS